MVDVLISYHNASFSSGAITISLFVYCIDVGQRGAGWGHMHRHAHVSLCSDDFCWEYNYYKEEARQIGDRLSEFCRVFLPLSSERHQTSTTIFRLT